MPLVGQTIPFVRNMYRFLEVRHARHGRAFRARVLGRRVVFLAGIPGAEAFYDADNVSREDAHPFPLVDLFGGVNMEMYDGPKHVALKAMARKAFDAHAIEGYLPGMQALVEGTLGRLAERAEFSATAELRRLSIEAICGNVLGLGRGPATDALCDDYARVLRGLVSLPVGIPGTPYARARAARDRLLATIRAVVAERRAKPGDDGLSRILAARAPDGRAFADDEAVLEVHHMVIAGFIVYALMAEVLRRLAEDPVLRARCVEEVRAHAPAGPLTMESLSRLRTSTNVVLETKRFVPLVPLAFGRARRDFAFEGFRVPAGWTVHLSLHLCNRDPAVFRDPERFDPDRFGPERAEHRSHPLAFIPQGAGPHVCLGLDYSTILVLTFLAALVRDHEWDLPPQDLTYRWSTIPPEPRDGLRVRLRRRGAAP
jgi:cytochrome P450